LGVKREIGKGGEKEKAGEGEADEEAQEGRDAFKEKREPDFGRFPKRP